MRSRSVLSLALFCSWLVTLARAESQQVTIPLRGATAEELRLHKSEQRAKYDHWLRTFGKVHTDSKLQESVRETMLGGSPGPFLDETAVHRAYPEVAPSDIQLPFCSGEDGEGTATFLSSPIGSHRTVAKHLQCQLRDSDAICTSLETRAVDFVGSPTKYFELESSATFEDAARIIELLTEGSVDARDPTDRGWLGNLPVRRIAKQGDDFVLTLADCECSLRVAVRLPPAHSRELKITQPLEGICF